MKTFMQKFNILLFLIAILSFQFSYTLELSSLSKVKSPKLQIADFEELCYYDLKVDIIIKNYVIRIQDQVNKLFEANSALDRKNIKFDFFWKTFKSGHYGEIAPELAGSEDYARSYWNYFVKPNSQVMTEVEFTKFMGLYYLEGQLLIGEIHPTLTKYFPNEHNVNNRLGCSIGLAFWNLTSELLQRIFIQFKWSKTTTTFTKTQVFTIISNTHTGKCWISGGKKCKFFDEVIGKFLGFFNMSSGKRDALDIKETKLAYSTFLFQDIFEPACSQKKFDGAMIEKDIEVMMN